MALSDQSEKELADQGFAVVRKEALIYSFVTAAYQAIEESNGKPFALMQPFQIGDYRYVENGRLINHRNVVIVTSQLGGAETLTVQSYVQPALDPRCDYTASSIALTNQMDDMFRNGAGLCDLKWVRPLPRHNFDWWRLGMESFYGCGPETNHLLVYRIKPEMCALALRR